MTLNPTHDPTLKSWIDSANVPHTDFPIQNLPLGVFRVAKQSKQIGVAIGTQILSLNALSTHGFLNHLPKELRAAAKSGSLNRLMRLGNGARLQKKPSIN
jgi:fumarylacetoacetase